MKRITPWPAFVACLFALMFAGCGVESGDEALNLTGIWDITDVTGKSVDEWTITQTGNDITGTGAGMPVNGTLSDNLVTMVLMVGPHPVTLSGTISNDGNSMAGTWVNDSNVTGTFSGLRRGTGSGVDMTGTWLSLDLTTSTSLSMQVTQTGGALSGTTISAPPATLSGTIAGNEVVFTMQAGGNTITWTGHLSVDGDTVTGHWVNTGNMETGSWRLTRQN